MPAPIKATFTRIAPDAAISAANLLYRVGTATPSLKAGASELALQADYQTVADALWALASDTDFIVTDPRVVPDKAVPPTTPPTTPPPSVEEQEQRRVCLHLAATVLHDAPLDTDKIVTVAGKFTDFLRGR